MKVSGSEATDCFSISLWAELEDQTPQIFAPKGKRDLNIPELFQGVEQAPRVRDRIHLVPWHLAQEPHKNSSGRKRFGEVTHHYFKRPCRVAVIWRDLELDVLTWVQDLWPAVIIGNLTSPNASVSIWVERNNSLSNKGIAKANLAEIYGTAVPYQGPHKYLLFSM